MSNVFESDPDIKVGDRVTVECPRWLATIYKGSDRVFIVNAITGRFIDLLDGCGKWSVCSTERGIRLFKPPRVQYDKYVSHMRRAVAKIRAYEHQKRVEYLQSHTMNHYERLTNDQLQRRR